MTSLTAFTNQLDNFVYYLENKFPDEMNIKTYHNSINMLKKVNPRKVLEFFNTYIYIYKEQIMSNNADFFLENDFKKELNENKDSMLTAIHFKDLWKKSSEDTHKQIFRYYQLLCLLAEKC